MKIGHQYIGTYVIFLGYRGVHKSQNTTENVFGLEFIRDT